VRARRQWALLAVPTLMVLGAFLAGCSGGGGEASTVLTGTSTRSSTVTRTQATRPTSTLPERTVTETTPAETVTTQPPRTATIVPTATTVHTQTQAVTLAQTTTVVNVTVASPETTAAAPADATPTSTQWGWIAFGILAAAVVVTGIVVWLRKRRTEKPAA